MNEKTELAIGILCFGAGCIAAATSGVIGALLAGLAGCLLGGGLGFLLFSAIEGSGHVTEGTKKALFVLLAIPVLVMVLFIHLGAALPVSLFVSGILTEGILLSNGLLCGYLSADRKMLEMAQVFRMPGENVLRYLVLPSAKNALERRIPLGFLVSFALGLAGCAGVFSLTLCVSLLLAAFGAGLLAAFFVSHLFGKALS